jgi:hypothetical protein
VPPERRYALNQMPSLTLAPDGFNVSLASGCSTPEPETLIVVVPETPLLI